MSELTALPRILVIVVGVMCLSGQIHGESSDQMFDPTRPQGWQASGRPQLEPEAPPVSALKLQGTFSIAGKRSAMINGHRVMVGDEVSGAEVVEIENNRVKLRVDGEMVEFASLLPDVKSPVYSTGDQK